MAIAPTLERYLKDRGVRYETLTHPRTYSSMATAELARVPGERLAKPVVLEKDGEYVMAVVPATHQVRLAKLGRQLHATLRLAPEEKLQELFEDCEFGAVPAVGPAYGVETVLDETLAHQPDIYFEAGDHVGLIHVSIDQYLALLPDSARGTFSNHVFSTTILPGAAT